MQPWSQQSLFSPNERVIYRDAKGDKREGIYRGPGTQKDTSIILTEDRVDTISNDLIVLSDSSDSLSYAFYVVPQAEANNIVPVYDVVPLNKAIKIIQKQRSKGFPILGANSHAEACEIMNQMCDTCPWCLCSIAKNDFSDPLLTKNRVCKNCIHHFGSTRTADQIKHILNESIMTKDFVDSMRSTIQQTLFNISPIIEEFGYRKLDLFDIPFGVSMKNIITETRQIFSTSIYILPGYDGNLYLHGRMYIVKEGSTPPNNNHPMKYTNSNDPIPMAQAVFGRSIRIEPTTEQMLKMKDMFQSFPHPFVGQLVCHTIKSFKSNGSEPPFGGR